MVLKCNILDSAIYLVVRVKRKNDELILMGILDSAIYLVVRVKRKNDELILMGGVKEVGSLSCLETNAIMY